MNNIIVMYHYVRNDTNFKAFSTEEFRKQVDYLKNRYRIISIKELIEEKPKDNTCILTFDDGIKDGYVNALPILEELNVKATFFIPAKILVDSDVIEAQKRHLLLTKIGAEKFVEEFNNLSDDIFKVGTDIEKYELDNQITSNLKYILDNMDLKESKRVVKHIFDKYFDEKEEFKKIHLNKKEIDVLESKGMEIGTHGYGHLYLGNLYFKDMERDLSKSVKVFNDVFEKHPLVMSYPFGSYNLFTKRLAKKLGYIAGVTIIKNKNKEINDPFSLCRYDCVDIFPRNNPSISTEV